MLYLFAFGYRRFDIPTNHGVFALKIFSKNLQIIFGKEFS